MITLTRGETRRLVRAYAELWSFAADHGDLCEEQDVKRSLDRATTSAQPVMRRLTFEAKTKGRTK